ncbi:unnamed protein product [Lasius platythorax]|uniref:Uncharacterized protein n=1 Tax=Lasius platythorax TaxID=488582 RepID=A0AAV2MYD5_9HYME
MEVNYKEQLPVQSLSDASELGVAGAIVPDSPASSSSLGLKSSPLSTSRAAADNLLYSTMSMKIEKRILAALNRIRSEVSFLHPKMCTALEIVSDSVEELSSIVVKLELARNYVMVGANQQEKQTPAILNNVLKGEFPGSVSPGIINRPPSVLRGDDPVEAGLDLA